jgi:hypothetical protein
VGQEIEESCRYTAPDRHPLILLKGPSEKLYPQTPATFRRTGNATRRARGMQGRDFPEPEASHVTSRVALLARNHDEGR